MTSPLTRYAAAALYQTSLVLGITMLPLALLARQVGVTLPLHRLVERTERAYNAVR
ncbi:hypothetical protein [Halospeciosus flavus]|uniref:Uncharacterized protein n=1 Tax=Halospeciosus flavus TaxID=3032283 RepID=A0ABD5Z3Q8_9EURY|nr:hypothetical protein [Halospeciosus flavus]